MRLAPLVSIDLVIRDRNGKALLGLRINEPAKGFYFVPGGRIWKNERVSEAFSRVLKSETNCSATIDDARFVGIFDHIYDANRFGDRSFGTHYVALAFEVDAHDPFEPRPDDQHSTLTWWARADILTSVGVHAYTKAYFQ